MLIRLTWVASYRAVYLLTDFSWNFTKDILWVLLLLIKWFWVTGSIVLTISLSWFSSGRDVSDWSLFLLNEKIFRVYWRLLFVVFEIVFWWDCWLWEGSFIFIELLEFVVLLGVLVFERFCLPKKFVLVLFWNITLVFFLFFY